MSNYVKSTDFAAKDALASGAAGKVITGTAHDTEYNNIATAIATKADLISPTLVTPNIGAATGTSLALTGGQTIGTSLTVGTTLGVTGVLTATGGVVGNVTGNATTVTIADAGGDTTTFPLLGTAATGTLAPATDAGLTYNATTNALSTTTFIGALIGNADTATNSSHDSQVFTANGTWTKPSWCTGSEVVEVEVWGGGGGGGSGSFGTGAGGGAYCCRRYLASTLAATESVVVGAGGAQGNPGTAGGTSTFSSALNYCVAYGGGGGYGTTNVGGGGGGTNGTGASGLGGGTGGKGYSSTSGAASGADAGSGDGGAGDNGSAYWGGAGGGRQNIGGGFSAFGGGGGGGSTTGAAGASLHGGNGGAAQGGAGVVPGGGGGGHGTAGSGGAGARGEVRVRVLA